MPEVIVRRGFLSRPECEAMMGAALALDDDWSGTGPWQGRILYLAPIQAAYPAVAALMRDATDRAIALIQLTYKSTEPLYADTVHIARWVQGMSMGLHADRTEEFPHRAYSSVLYLNEGFGGGLLFFPREGVTVRPEVGMLVAFTAWPDHEHGVTTVTGGPRYTMPAFYTHDLAQREVVAATRYASLQA